MHLCLDPLDADLLVDLSNVCSRAVLGGAAEVDLSRLAVAAAAYGRLVGLDDVWVFAVADESLFRRLSAQADRRQLREWVQDGRVESLPGADERLLQLVEVTGAPLMTWDRFHGHRDTYPWIQGNTEHFVLVTASSAGLAAAFRDMGTVDARLVSERAEVDTLKASHLLDARGRPDSRVLSRWWRCPEPQCPLFSSDHEHGQPVPTREGQRLLCSLHRRELVDAGPRQRVLQLKVGLEGRVAGRVSVRETAPVVLGRTAGPGRVALGPLMPTETLDLVSREHVRVAVKGPTWAVTDLGSSNGSSVLEPDGSTRRLLPNVETLLDLQARVVMGGQVHVTVSGRRYPFLGGPSLSAGSDVLATRLAD